MRIIAVIDAHAVIRIGYRRAGIENSTLRDYN